MKPNIHPQYSETTFTCSCGGVLKTNSTLASDQHVDICSECHPFFCGKLNKQLDTAGRIEKFNKRYRKAS